MRPDREKMRRPGKKAALTVLVSVGAGILLAVLIGWAILNRPRTGAEPARGRQPRPAGGEARVTEAEKVPASAVSVETPAAAPATEEAKAAPAKAVRPVSNIKVVSDKVDDVTTLEEILGWMIKPGMSDQEKALAVFDAVVKFHRHDAPPVELFDESHPDPVKIFNVYGYGLCCCQASNVEALARAVGLDARGKGIIQHSVPEVHWGNAWHLLDASLINYFFDKGGEIASVDEIVQSVREWHDKSPGYEGNDAKLRQFMRNGGWRKGPRVLATAKFYDENGWLPAATHGWYSTMAEYGGKSNFVYEYGYTMGYRALFRLRPGEALTRNWSNKGLHVNMDGGGGTPGCLKERVGTGSMRYTPQYGDLAPGRVGNGTLLYRVPLSGNWRGGAWRLSNIATGQGLAPASTDAPAEAVFRMHCPYVFLKGKVGLAGRKAEGASLKLSLSTNNGLDWKELGKVAGTGRFSEEIDLGAKVLRRYDYYVKLVLEGDVRLERLEFENDVQHSQRALPALTQGENVITVSADPPTDTITVAPSLKKDIGGKNEVLADFRAVVEGVKPDRDGLWCASYREPALVTIPVETPGDIHAVRLGGHYRARDSKDGIDFLLSFDDGKTWLGAGKAWGPFAGYCKHVEFRDAPQGSRKVLVRYKLTQARNTTGIMGLRVDVDYWDTPDGKPVVSEAMSPFKVTYVWRENGAEKRHVHVTRKPTESYAIICGAAPVMRSLIVELAGRP